ncbi:N-acetyl-gamma-glutamyl-phosphate reductase [Anaerotignum neopropionicum]|mgnify:CR=1 FL=1|uniref:N-acetyl-gamma-glutamyl-phosphate reductase n=1 Tax=Anaerotignum neopropionicum TaxID=36847 RepID=A0A136WHS2_9FIRM|nr:N-acetyl-gamma-glutamyl-phosphate reductase [Anaerotignum neopropionicum]KXL54118.1 N-acetyl-gamma-glutamyl-phosphate reductase [Anaerotignum neopropionicum]
MKHKIFIDGQVGTTGLQLRQRLEHHPNIELMLISEELRKDETERKRLMNRADVVFLCLPDAAAKEAVTLVENPEVCIIDASTAHRTNPLWTYGFPELSPRLKEEIAKSKRIANPGCHATGFIAAVYPLVKLGIVSPDYPFSAHSITGYSGGGKGMIQEYEAADRSIAYESPRQYALSQAHKHLPEMQYITGLSAPPVFSPIVCDFYRGMETCVPLQSRLFSKKITKAELTLLIEDFYKESSFIKIAHEESGFLPSNLMADSNGLILYIEGNDEQITITSVFDNLGKGASGAAVQNMNIVLGLDETESLI